MQQQECDWSPTFDFYVPANRAYCPTPPSPIEISSDREEPLFGCGTCQDDLEGSNYTLDSEERSREEDSTGSLCDFIASDLEMYILPPNLDVVIAELLDTRPSLSLREGMVVTRTLQEFYNSSRLPVAKADAWYMFHCVSDILARNSKLPE